MHPATFDQYRLMKAIDPRHEKLARLEGAQHFFVGEAIQNLAHAIAVGEVGREDFRFPDLARLPGASVCLVIENKTGVDTTYLLSAMPDDYTFVHQLFDGHAVAVGGFQHGARLAMCLIGGNAIEQFFASQLSDNDRSEKVTQIAFILALINLPRKVKNQFVQNPRQLRREIDRKTGATGVGYFRVGWNIGKAVSAQGGQITTAGHENAFHWVRSYWAKASEGEPKAEYINLPTKEGWGWYRWVADCFRGNPEVGIRLHHYDPRVQGQEKAPGRFVLFSASSAERLALMDAAKRAALQQAGYAV